MLFETILMKFDAHELVEAGGFLGPFSFSLFIIFIVFICIRWEKSMKEEQKDLEYMNPIEQFPEKIDQLLNALNRLYTNQYN
ncbi:unnamed protein product [Adineta steineri]|uniref:Uncharacterized protein n=1 Tax=Adineta steineri TaxID=433720 RepID=A0A819SJ34_9BILA|nr:unnamed protein product [Adineta steineri]